MSRKGHIPLRRCVACGATRPRDTLIRLARLDGAGVVVDEQKRLGGRGAYLCPTRTCVDRVTKRGIPARAPRAGAGWTLSAETAGLLRDLARGDGDGQAHL